MSSKFGTGEKSKTRIWREVGNLGMMLRSWPRIERDGRCLCVACIVEHGQRGNDDEDDDDDDDDEDDDDEEDDDEDDDDDDDDDDELWCCPLKDTEDKLT